MFENELMFSGKIAIIVPENNQIKTKQHLSPQLCPADKCRNMVTQKFVSFWSLGDLLARESELAC